ncbi:MAG TPA: S1C family serine protease, partial [Kofleriaceae bacterium]
RPMRACVPLALSLAVAACSGSQKPQRTLLSTKEIVTRNKPAIVRITSDQPGGVGVGTGFIVSSDGRIATNLHVIVGSAKVKVKLLDGTEHQVTRVIAADEKHDLAIIAIDATGLPTLNIGNSDEVNAGDRVVAIGNPLGFLDYTVSDGLISSIRPLDENVTLLQISAPISQGSSGGPLFNPYGEVIGVAVGIVDPKTGGQNLNFGIPSNYLKPLIAFRGSGEDVQTFAKRFAKKGVGTASECDQRRPGIPCHEVGILDGCTPDQVAGTYLSIQQAIELGAPAYNQGHHEACFNIYRDIAAKIEGDKQMCKGIRDAFGQGLLKAETRSNFKDRAWDMRDTFDGLVNVIERKATAARPGAKP